MRTGSELDLRKPQVMTILNVTPDSFYAGSRTPRVAEIERRIGEAVEAGCSIIDVGGYSSRSGAEVVPPEEEWRRVAEGVGAVRRIAPARPCRSIRSAPRWPSGPSESSVL